MESATLAASPAVVSEETMSRADVLKAAAAAALMGLVLVFTTGFAHPQLLHNAAHDSRHALSFPCH
jgi:cobalt transporter subunit CbtB